MSPLTIPEFYNGRSVFITGASGFMGKVLVEKLLRSCPGISRLYVLMRPSRTGKGVSDRLQELLNCEVFAALRQSDPRILDKVVPIRGDISLSTLGISDSDLNILSDTVSVVFHLAARVKLDENLKAAFESNVKGPQKVVGLCRKLKNLKAFVHVSTAYIHLEQKEKPEVLYPLKYDAQKMMDFIESIDDKLVVDITRPLIGSCPNVYAFTKALGEQLLQNECKSDDIPLIIFRPSYVTASMNEPLPGWVDNLNGPSGLTAGVGKGVIRVVKTDGSLIGDMIPCDYAINMMIAAAWSKGLEAEPAKEVDVYHAASGALNPIIMNDFVDRMIEVWKKYPIKALLWYPSCVFRVNHLLFTIEFFLYHYIPGYFLDFVAKLIGQEPTLVPLYDKVVRGASVVQYYTLNEWIFLSENPQKLLKKMSDEDQKTFPFDIRQLDWNAYIENYVLGARKFLLEEEMSTLPTARANLKRMRFLRDLMRAVLFGLFAFILLTLFRRFFMQ